MLLRNAVACAVALYVCAAPQRLPSEREAYLRHLEHDWAGLQQFALSNRIDRAKPPAHRRVVFIGDSITGNWQVLRSSFFRSHGFVARGIAGQTSPQVLLRFKQDALGLEPEAVHIMVGVNDVAGYTGPFDLKAVQANIQAMATLAEAEGVAVVLATAPPVKRIFWRPELRPAPQIQALNEWLRNYAEAEGYGFADYTPVLAKPTATYDGVHPGPVGYAAMEPIALAAIEDTVKERSKTR